MNKIRCDFNDNYSSGSNYAAGGNMDRIDWSRNEYRNGAGNGHPPPSLRIILFILVILSIVANIARNHNDTLFYNSQNNSPFSFSDINSTVAADNSSFIVTGNVSSTKTIMSANVRFTAYKDPAGKEVIYTETYHVGRIMPGEKKPFSFLITMEKGNNYGDAFFAAAFGLTKLTAYTDELRLFPF